ncbi:MAG: N-formylglutamate amidohydrolase [Rhodospirillales bacterium]
MLAADEPPAYEVVNNDGAGSAVIVCDHACNRIPVRLGTLGLEADDLASHIAWDIGAAEVAVRLAGLLDAPLVRSGYSRLVVDCNRPLASAESIAPHSGGITVPGNQGLSASELALRAGAVFWPYHRAVAAVLDHRAARAQPSVLLSVHSFTPALNGSWRPWHIGFAHGRDARLAALFLDAFHAEGETAVGYNQPYSVDDATDYTLPVHGEQRGLMHVLIEIRQDGLVTADDVGSWAERLARCYARIALAG